MLTQVKDRTLEISEWYEVVFDDGRGNGFGFPCDKDGKPDDDMMDVAKDNYNWCMANPGRFERFNRVIHHKRSWWNPRTAVCECGDEFYLQNEYMGACECPNCGKWYSLNGDELLPPDEWGWDGTPMDEDY